MAESKQAQKYKILAGTHSVQNVDDQGERTLTTFRKGEVIESTFDLVKKFGPEKFKRIKAKGEPDPEEDDEEGDDETPSAPQSEDDGLDNLSDPELAKFAEEAGIKTKGKSREQVLKAVRESLVNA